MAALAARSRSAQLAPETAGREEDLCSRTWSRCAPPCWRVMLPRYDATFVTPWRGRFRVRFVTKRWPSRVWANGRYALPSRRCGSTTRPRSSSWAPSRAVSPRRPSRATQQRPINSSFRSPRTTSEIRDTSGTRGEANRPRPSRFCLGAGLRRSAAPPVRLNPLGSASRLASPAIRERSQHCRERSGRSS